MNPMNADGRIPFAVEPGWEDSCLIRNVGGPSYRLLFYSDTDVVCREQSPPGLELRLPQPGGAFLTG
jgi:hypothetical protein